MPKKKWDDMTPAERLAEWESTALEWEMIVERRKERNAEILKQLEEREGKKSNPTGS